MNHKYVQFFNFRLFHKDPYNTFMTFSGAHMSKMKRILISSPFKHHTLSIAWSFFSHMFVWVYLFLLACFYRGYQIWYAYQVWDLFFSIFYNESFIVLSSKYCCYQIWYAYHFWNGKTSISCPDPSSSGNAAWPGLFPLEEWFLAGLTARLLEVE